MILDKPFIYKEIPISRTLMRKELMVKRLMGLSYSK